MTDKTITFKLTAGEKIALQKLASLHNQSISSYIKHRIFDYQDQEEKEIFTEYTKQPSIEIMELSRSMDNVLKTVMNTHAIIDIISKEKLTDQEKQQIKEEVNKLLIGFKYKK